MRRLPGPSAVHFDCHCLNAIGRKKTRLQRVFLAKTLNYFSFISL
jgi:hypothetical protein